MKHVVRKGDQIVIPVLAIEFREGGNTLWIHGQGGTVLRLKTVNGAITSKSFLKTVRFLTTRPA